MQYGYSFDGIEFLGRHESIKAALAAAMDRRNDAIAVWICECHQPAAESYVDADDVLDVITAQDDYCVDAVEAWPDASPEQKQELTDALRRVIGEWLDRHGLRDSFYAPRNVRRFALIDGSWVEITEDE